jgi:toxin YhaV
MTPNKLRPWCRTNTLEKVRKIPYIFYPS